MATCSLPLKIVFLALATLVPLTCCQVLSNCSADQFWNGMQCNNCSRCSGERESVRKNCTPASDAECITCPENFEYGVGLEVCLLQCQACPTKRCATEAQCRCPLPQDCYSTGDVFCTSPRDDCVPTEEPPTVQSPPSTFQEETSIPAWGIGVIAVGAVVGIIAFSSLFLLIGLISSKKSGSDSIGSDESGQSETGLVSGGSGFSNGTHSSYLSSPLLSKHSLDILRHSPTVLSSVMSSPTGSPRLSSRNSHGKHPFTSGSLSAASGDSRTSPLHVTIGNLPKGTETSI